MNKIWKKAIASVLAVTLCVGTFLTTNWNIASAEAATNPTESLEVSGASIRFINENTAVDGIRFAVRLSANVFNALTEEQKENYHLLVMPTALVDGELEIGETFVYDGGEAKAQDVTIDWSNAKDEGEYKVVRIFLNGIDISYYDTMITARAYYQEAGADPVYSSALERSYSTVARAALNDTGAGYTDVEQTALMGVFYQITSGVATLKLEDNGVTVTQDGGKEVRVLDVQNTILSKEKYAVEVTMSAAATSGWSENQEGVIIGGRVIALNKSRVSILEVGSSSWSNYNSDVCVNTIPSGITSSNFTLIVAESDGIMEVYVRIGGAETLLVRHTCAVALANTSIQFYSSTNTIAAGTMTSRTFSDVKVTEEKEEVRYQLVSGTATLEQTDTSVTIKQAKNTEVRTQDLTNVLPNKDNFTVEVDMSPVYGTSWSQTQQGLVVGGVLICMNSTRLVVNHNGTNLLYEAAANDAGTISALANPIPTELKTNNFTWIVKVSKAGGATKLTVSVKVNDSVTVLIDQMSIDELSNTNLLYHTSQQAIYNEMTTTFGNVNVINHSAN